MLYHSLKSKIMLKTTAALFRQGNCSCGENYVGESVRNVVLNWAELEDPNKQLTINLNGRHCLSVLNTQGK